MTMRNMQGQGYLHKCHVLLMAVEFDIIILLLAKMLRPKCDSNCYPTKAGHTSVTMTDIAAISIACSYQLYNVTFEVTAVPQSP